MKPKKDNQEPILDVGAASLAAPEPVCSILRRNRKQMGQDLKTVAQALRIRYVYLEAIEQGRYDALPGSTYALGFIKTYAEYLNLDEEEIVQRFRDDVDGLDDQTQLVFPSPVPEGKVPGGAILLVALIMGSLAYGGWYALSSRDSRLVDFIPALPDRLQAMFEEGTPDTKLAAVTMESKPAEAEAPESSAVSEPESVASTPSEPQTPASQAAATNEVTISETAQVSASASSSGPAQTTPPVSESASVAPVPAAPSSNETQAASVPDVGATAAAPSASLPQNQSTAAPVVGTSETGTTVISSQSVTSLGSSETEIPAAPAAPIPTQTVAVPDATQPQVYGEDNADARIILRATQDAWVQVRDRSDELLLTRVLREGDVYRVPNEEGLTLLTGNAGGIEVLVDGTLMAPLGPVGSVRRDLALDPQVLLAGTTSQ